MARSILTTAALIAMTSLASAADVKVGIIASMTGPYGIWGKEYREGIELYLDQIKSKAGDNNISVIYRDVGGANPPRSRQLAQELIVREGVSVLGGQELTPNVLAVSDVINQAKVPFVIFNTGTGNVTDQSPYFVRVGFTQWANYYPLGEWAAKQGLKRCVTVGADFAAGRDSLAAVTKSFTAGGGQVLQEILIPLDATDFSPYLQRIRDASPECALSFMPFGPSAVAFVKAYIDRGLLKSGIRLLNQQEASESELPSIGDGAVGIQNVMPYGPYLDNPVNKAFVAAFQAKYGKDRVPSVIHVMGYDGMHVMAEMIKATGGQRNGDQALAVAKGMAWDSPRGPVSIDPATRELTQNIYIRQVVKENGVLYNKVIDTFRDVKEPWHELNKPQAK